MDNNYYRTRAHPVDLEPIRRYAQDCVEALSLRVVAAQMGLGHSTVHNFVTGTMPYPRVRRAVVEWYEGQLDAATQEAQQSVSSLLSLLPSSLREDGAQRLRGCVAQIYRDAGVDPPPWIAGGG